MSIEIKVPDIGDFEEVEIVDVLVSVGDTIQQEDPLISLETDKAVMDVPAEKAGKITEILVKEGDKVSQGDVILLIESEAGSSADNSAESQPRGEGEEKSSDEQDESKAGASAPEKPKPSSSESKDKGDSAEKNNVNAQTQTISVPDIGDFTDVPIVDILVKEGDSVSEEDPLISLETDKAVMDVPCPASGVISKILVSVDDKVSQGDAIIELKSAESSSQSQGTPQADSTEAAQAAESTQATGATEPAEEKPKATENKHKASASAAAATKPSRSSENAKAHAGPATRKMARKLGVDLGKVSGTGPHDRILKEDIEAFVKTALNNKTSNNASGFSLPPAKAVDFSKFGKTQRQELTKINRLTGENTHNSWLRIPHVTHHEKADITELEAFRKQENAALKEGGTKLTLLPFLVKAAVAALKAYPRVNSSLDPDGQTLILKQYFHISIAVDTAHGLMVPVIYDADKKSLSEIANEINELADKARNRKLTADSMQGGCFSLSSLGHIGGTGFTPIVNEPEVAIMGITRSELEPKYRDGNFEPRLMLPLSLSYDHRVIDGVLAAKFSAYFASRLEDIRRLLV